MEEIYHVINVKDYGLEFEGNICECEAWIRLMENGYIIDKY